MREKITTIVPTFNNEKIIRRCLENVKWADEILIVDSFSTDKTLDICREYTDRIIQHKYITSALQKNWAIPQAAHDWIFLLDTDEYLEEGLVDEIIDVLKNPKQGIEGYYFPRKNLIYDKWIRNCGIYPDSLVRLFKRKYRYQEREVHAHIDIPPEKTDRFKHHIIHDDFNDIESYLNKFARYMRYECDEYWKKGRRYRLWNVTLRPLYFFLWSYLFKKGYKDGIRGLLLSVNRAYYNFMICMKLWEREYYEKRRVSSDR
jgi:glycosyltransferase involved in cell wall biosynthesis